MSPSSHYVQCAGYEIHYTQWGAQHAPVVMAWHGLARTGRDMDDLAEQLAPHYRVICPDIIGRGLSEWSRQPALEYCLAFYARIARELFDNLRIEQAHWVGTSMGGAIGTVCAAGLFEPSLKPRISSLTLNDNAPELAASAIARIREYAGNPPAFATLLELEAFYRQVYKPFGWLSAAQWRRLTETSARRLPNGMVTPHYDPAMVQQFIAHPDDYLIWQHYDLLDIPVLCLRGAQSDLVEAHTVEVMRGRGPGEQGRLQVVEVSGCGHAPALNVPEQWNHVARFLEANQS